ncbi:hypothetical protein [Thermaerobacillus caldiproteolyticus]|uniref:Sporulation protein n=1 Tax=Thermaerobacillus caldiproteolyticus TaxID=247480 RepID=A0A7V9Z5K0_9BACL|nr:hypothetical protein [Anoxybacillus caldiproteolyticus]MBA2874458.1 hypothetical protein [Anoxybacillus caldiproteolyticus]QPA30843.1 hypothetical protein ISX45_15005 [Anoxybacillus caldiproteolyticus]
MKSLLLLLLGILLSACTMNPNDSQYHQQSEDKNGTRLITHDRAQKDYDRYLYNNFDDPEKTNQNPNFISLTEGSENNQADVRKAVQVIEKYTNYEPSSVWINGNDMWVSVQAPDSVSTRQREKDRTRLYELLTKAIPTYDIHVNIK